MRSVNYGGAPRHVAGLIMVSAAAPLEKYRLRFGNLITDRNAPVGAFLAKTFGPIAMSDIALVIGESL